MKLTLIVQNLTRQFLIKMEENIPNLIIVWTQNKNLNRDERPFRIKAQNDG